MEIFMRNIRSLMGAALIGISCMFTLTGCGSAEIPDMTEEETALVSEYIVGMIVKYDQNKSSKLVDTEEMPDSIQKEIDKKLREQKRAEDKANNTGNDEDSKKETEGGEVAPPTYTDIAQFLGLEGVQIQYSNYQAYDQYPPQNETSALLPMGAAEGKQLVVVEFNMTNITDGEVSVDILSTMPRFRFRLGEDRQENVLATVFENDLGTYQGILQANESTSLVLIMQLKKEDIEQIKSLGLVMKANGETATTTLF